MPVTGGPDIVNENLVFSIDAEDINSNNLAGTRFNDLTYPYTGTPQNGAYLDSTYPKSFVLDGSNDRINYGNVNCHRSTGTGWSDFTVETWVYPQNLTTSLRCIASKSCWSPEPTFEMYIHSGGSRLSYYYGAYRNWDSTNLTFSSDTWYHVVGTWKAGGQTRIYQNGELKDSTNTPYLGPKASNCTLYIGANRGVYNYFKGKIALMRIYQKELSAQEILHHYNINKKRFGL